MQSTSPRICRESVKGILIATSTLESLYARLGASHEDQHGPLCLVAEICLVLPGRKSTSRRRNWAPGHESSPTHDTICASYRANSMPCCLIGRKSNRLPVLQPRGCLTCESLVSAQPTCEMVSGSLDICTTPGRQQRSRRGAVAHPCPHHHGVSKDLCFGFLLCGLQIVQHITSFWSRPAVNFMKGLLGDKVATEQEDFVSKASSVLHPLHTMAIG